MSTADEFVVDADQLARTVDEIAACGEVLHQIATELAARSDSLHLSWEGTAAGAHHEAQTEWQRGFRDMRDALDQIRAAARTACANYTSAAGTNVRMWRQVG